MCKPLEMQLGGRGRCAALAGWQLGKVSGGSGFASSKAHACGSADDGGFEHAGGARVGFYRTDGE